MTTAPFGSVPGPVTLDVDQLDTEALAQLFAGAEERFSKPRKPDSMEDLRARLTGV